MHRQQMVFSGKASRELKVFTGAVQEIVATAVDVFENEDSHLAEFIEPLEEVIDSLQEELKMRSYYETAGRTVYHRSGRNPLGFYYGF